MFPKLQRRGFYFVVSSYEVFLVHVPISPYVTYKEGTIQIEPIDEFNVPIVFGRDSEHSSNCNEGAIILWFRATHSF